MKRLLDIIIALIIMLIFSPLLIIISAIIFFFQGKSIIFKHPRLGRNHKQFKIYKFCTMTDSRNLNGDLLPDKDRTTKIGEFLRRTSLDEIPGFLNVLIGDMSIVGPRPLPIQYINRYSKEQDKRHLVKPGVTGWAQINGRNAISWEEKFKYDVWYVDNYSILLDIKILFLTVNYVLSRKDIVPYNKDSMEEFMGTKADE